MLGFSLSIVSMAVAGLTASLSRVLSKYTRSPAGIYDSKGYLQTPANLLTWSQDFTNAAWSKSAVNISSETVTASAPGAANLNQTQSAFGGIGATITAARIVKVGTLNFATLGSFGDKDVYFDLVNITAAVGTSGTNSPTTSSIIDIGDGYRLCAATWVKSSATNTVFFSHSDGYMDQSVPSGATLLCKAHGTFAGTFTASQLAAMGGIPWTRETASVSLTLGPEIIQSVQSGAEWSVSGTDATHIATFSAAGLRYQSDTTSPALSVSKGVALTVGKTYVASGVCSAYTSGGLKSSFNGGTVALCSAAGAFTAAPAVATLTFFDITRSTTNVDMTISSLSVRELISTPCPVYTDAHAYIPGLGSISGLPTENYTSSTGDTGYSAVDGVVGLALDAMGTVGADVLAGAGSFSSSAGWGLSSDATISAGLLNIATTAISRVQRSAGLTVGKTYKATLLFSNLSGARICVFDNAGTGGGTSQYASLQVANGPAQFIFTAAYSGDFRVMGVTGTGSFSVDDLVIQEITGIHCTQPTTANKPLEVRGARNLLTYSNTFSNAAWVKGAGGTGSAAVATDNYALDPDGGMTAARVVLDRGAGTTASDYSRMYQLIPSAATQASQFWLKSNTGSSQVVEFANGSDVTLATVTTTWQKFTRTSVTKTDLTLLARGTTTAQVVDLLVWHAQCETGSTASAYSPTTTAAASNPLAGAYSWAFDGNDSLALGSVPFQMSDDHCVIAVARCDSASGDRTIFSQRSTASGTPIVCGVDVSGGSARATWRDDANVLAACTGSAVSGDFVISARKLTNAKILRVNAVQRASDNTVLGAATVTSAAVGVSPLASPNSYFIGSLGPVIVIKGTVTDAELLALERLIGQLAGIAI